MLQSLPYTEKVDVYSWALIAWQLAADYVPFKGLGKDEFTRKVRVRCGRVRCGHVGMWG